MRHLLKGLRGIDFRLSQQKIMALKEKLCCDAGLAGSLVALVSAGRSSAFSYEKRRNQENICQEFHVGRDVLEFPSADYQQMATFLAQLSHATAVRARELSSSSLSNRVDVFIAAAFLRVSVLSIRRC